VQQVASRPGCFYGDPTAQRNLEECAAKRTPYRLAVLAGCRGRFGAPPFQGGVVACFSRLGSNLGTPAAKRSTHPPRDERDDRKQNPDAEERRPADAQGAEQVRHDCVDEGADSIEQRGLRLLVQVGKNGRCVDVVEVAERRTGIHVAPCALRQCQHGGHLAKPRPRVVQGRWRDRQIVKHRLQHPVDVWIGTVEAGQRRHSGLHARRRGTEVVACAADGGDVRQRRA